MDESKTPPTHLGSCRYLTLSLGGGFVHHLISILYHEVPNPNLTIRNFFIAVVHLMAAQHAVLVPPQRVELVHGQRHQRLHLSHAQSWGLLKSNRILTPRGMDELKVLSSTRLLVSDPPAHQTPAQLLG